MWTGTALLIPGVASLVLSEGAAQLSQSER